MVTRARRSDVFGIVRPTPTHPVLSPEVGGRGGEGGGGASEPRGGNRLLFAILRRLTIDHACVPFETEKHRS